MNRSVTILLLVALAGSASGLTLNRYFTDNMVLQRDKPLVIRGTAEDGAEVTVTFANQTKSANADKDGNWVVTLDPVSASAQPQPLTAVSSSANHPSTIDNIVVGDVFLHARQTSIDITLGKDEEGRRVAAATKPNPMLRAISIKAIPSATPLHDLTQDATTGWRVVDRDSALGMTDSSYHLGRDLAKDTEVPIGIIDVNLGAAFANSWFSREELLITGRFPNDDKVAKDVTRYETELAAELAGQPLGRHGVVPRNTLQDPLYPAAGYNGTLHPLAGTAMKAAMVQLGNDYPYMLYQQLLESDNPSDVDALNHAYKETYLLRKDGFRMEDSVVPRVAREWRKVLGDETLPFGLIVPPGSDLNTLAQHHREMRELQRLTAEDIPGVDIILPGTEHIPFSAQPADGALLGKRSLRWIDGAVYQKPDAPATGPLFERFEADYNEATIHFKENTARGLQAKGDALDYFEVANVEGDYHPATAHIDGETIRLASDTVVRIARVRYNWNQKPNQMLVNAAGLPAIPFRSERTGYDWFVRNEEDDWAEEYFLPANEWAKNDVTLINVSLQRKGYDNFSGWIGPAGFRVGPFGPNMGVGAIREGSPADGKLLVGDVIYSANGKMLGEQAWLVMSAAITESETRNGNGRLVLGVRRGTENIEVELTLEVLGTYSSTAPYDCPKTEKIVDKLLHWIVSGASRKSRRTDFLGSDTMFLLATGDPEVLGFVRRTLYDKLARTRIVDEIDPTRGSKRAWFHAWDALLLGEYYMATGDRNVLPYLKFHCDQLAARQHPLGSWRHNFPGGDGYGLIPAIGLPAAIGFHLANAAGLDIDQEAYRTVLKYYRDGQAEMGRVLYGVRVSISAPPEFEPEKIKNGRMSTYNGALGSAAILYDLEGDTKTAHLCSFMSAHAWNHTFPGHGGNFWNNFWTPLGAKVHGEKSFVNFWQNYRWYWELGRNPDGSYNFDGFKDLAGYAIPLVAPRERIQIAGAPRSPFAANAPDYLKPALAAYWQKEYAEAGTLANELIASGIVGMDEMPTVEYLARAANEMQQSIEADLARMQKLMDAGELSEAKSFLPGLQGVLEADDPRLVAMQDNLANVQAQPVSRPEEEEEDADEVAEDDTDQPPERPRQWECLVMDNQVKNPKRIQRERHGPIVTSNLEQPSIWRLTVIEELNQAPEGWFEPQFDDSDWLETTLPTSWRMYHTALLRTRFQVDDKDRFDGLRLYSWILRQQNVQIYLNGELIAKVNGAGNTTNFEHEFKPSALQHLKNGENTLAITTRHNWRWGHGALRVYNNGFDFNLDARLKE